MTKLLSMLLLMVLPGCLQACQSLGIYTKEGLTIAAVGSFLPSSVSELNVPADKTVFAQALEEWKKAPKPIALILSESEVIEPDIKQIHTRNYRNNYFKTPLGLMLNCAAAALSGKKAGSLKFIYTKHPVPRKFSAQALIHDVENMIGPALSIENASDEVRTRFFVTQGKTFFPNLLKSCQSNDRTLESFRADLQKELQYVKSLKAKHPKISVIDQLITDYEVYIAQVMGFLRQLTGNNEKSTICSALFTLCTTQRSFHKAFEEFKKQIDIAKPKITELCHFVTILEHAQTYSNIFILDELVHIGNLDAFFRTFGFAGEFRGKRGFAGEYEPYDPRHGIFQEEHLRLFFKRAFSGNPFLPEVTEKKQSFVNMITHQVQPVPFLDHSTVVCKRCHTTFEKHRGRVFVSPQEAYCSLSCFIEEFIKRNSSNDLSILLQNNDSLNDSQRNLLKRAAALCYYRSLMLSDSVNLDINPFYREPHNELLTLFDGLLTSTHTENTRQLQALELFGIKVDDLKFFCTVYKKTKDDYVKKLISRSLKRKYDALEMEEAPLFDADNIIKKYRTNQIQTIKKRLGLAQETPDISIVLLYSELLMRILKKLEHESLDFKMLLHQELDRKPQVWNPQSIEQILRDIGIDAKDEPQLDDVNQDSDVTSTDTHEPEKKEAPDDEGTVSSQPPVIEYLPHRKQRPLMTSLSDLFAGKERYHITLFKTREYFEKNDKAQHAFESFKKGHPQLHDSFRVKCLFALEDAAEEARKTILRDRFNKLFLRIAQQKDVDESILEKLNIDHLFSRKVDHYLASYGIVERDGNCIRVSIPGEVKDCSGTLFVGFFQYTFVEGSWLCIHRCFANYNAHKSDGLYISKPLRVALFKFLSVHMKDSIEYKPMLKELEQLCAT